MPGHEVLVPQDCLVPASMEYSPYEEKSWAPHGLAEGEKIPSCYHLDISLYNTLLLLVL